MAKSAARPKNRRMPAYFILWAHSRTTSTPHLQSKQQVTVGCIAATHQHFTTQPARFQQAATSAMSTLRMPLSAALHQRRQRARVDGAGDVRTNDWSPKSRTSLEPVLAKVGLVPQPTLRRRPSTVSSQPGAVYRCIASSTDNSWSGADGNQQLVSDSLVREEDAPLSQSSMDLPAYFAGAKISHVQPLHTPCPAGYRT